MAERVFDVVGDQIEHALIITRHGYGSAFKIAPQSNSAGVVTD